VTHPGEISGRFSHRGERMRGSGRNSPPESPSLGK
jgi:hypothetical protein